MFTHSLQESRITIQDLENARVMARQCAISASDLRQWALPGEEERWTLIFPFKAASLFRNLSIALRLARQVLAIKQWLSGSKPVTFANRHADSAHSLALEIAESVYLNAAHAIDSVANDDADRGLRIIECRGAPAWVARGFVVPKNAHLTEVEKLWRPKTDHFLRSLLNQLPKFTWGPLAAMIECDFGRARRRLEQWSYREHGREHGDVAQSFDTEVAAAHKIPSIQLGESWSTPALVRGKQKTFQSYAEFLVIQKLKQAGSEGLKKDELEEKSCNARKILKKLRQDPDWKAVIRMAEKKGNRYRLLDNYSPS